MKYGGTVSVLTPGSYFAVDSTTIGPVYYQNSVDILNSGSWAANATQARVDQTLQQIAYSNSSDTLPASVVIGWTFDDGYTGQSSGGALSTTGRSPSTLGQ